MGVGREKDKSEKYSRIRNELHNQKKRRNDITFVNIWLAHIASN